VGWLVPAVGWAGAVTSSLLAVPQAVKLYRNPNEVAGLSLATWLLLLVNAALWLVYAAGSGAYPVAVPSLINGPLAAYIVVKLLASRRR
jgi:uncharacterized protein with PQ loop repeat